GGEVLYSGPLEGLQKVKASRTREFLSTTHHKPQTPNRRPTAWLKLSGVTRNNLNNLDAAFPLGVLTSVTGVSGSGKSSLVSQVLVELVSRQLGQEVVAEADQGESIEHPIVHDAPATLGGRITAGMDDIKRL